MTSLDFLYISLGVGFLVLVGFLSNLIRQMTVTLTKADHIVDNIGETTDSVMSVKDALSSSTLRVISKFLKGGDYVTG